MELFLVFALCLAALAAARFSIDEPRSQLLPRVAPETRKSAPPIGLTSLFKEAMSRPLTQEKQSESEMKSRKRKSTPPQGKPTSSTLKRVKSAPAKMPHLASSKAERAEKEASTARKALQGTMTLSAANNAVIMADYIGRRGSSQQQYFRLMQGINVGAPLLDKQSQLTEAYTKAGDAAKAAGRKDREERNKKKAVASQSKERYRMSSLSFHRTAAKVEHFNGMAWDVHLHGGSELAYQSLMEDHAVQLGSYSDRLHAMNQVRRQSNQLRSEGGRDTDSSNSDASPDRGRIM